tara:strand:- start:478 stop:645 length:168 start_codon:yes stop_codon:yes gene_type:complete
MHSYEELFYRSYTKQELINILSNPKHLNSFRARCKMELDRRQNEEGDESAEMVGI